MMFLPNLGFNMYVMRGVILTNPAHGVIFYPLDSVTDLVSPVAMVLSVVGIHRPLVSALPCAVWKALGLELMGEQVLPSGDEEALSLESGPQCLRMQHLPDVAKNRQVSLLRLRGIQHRCA